MGLSFSKQKATGRAKCQLCGCKIRKGLNVIHVSGYQASGYCHVRCDKVAIALRELAQ